MLDRVQQILQRDCHLDKIHPIILGVSGGADSLTLMDIFAKLNYRLVVAHFNHLLRPEADGDAKVVEKVATEWMLPFILKEESAADYAKKYNLSIEEAARELRYRFLFDQAEKFKAQAVAVAHTANDQVETALMHLLRGAGLDGLTGMTQQSIPTPWSQNIPLVRPLLSIWRSEIEDYCTQNHLVPVIDLTNTDTTFFRNRLRYELIPELETYIPGFQSRFWQTTDLLAADRAVLDKLTEKIWQKIIHQIGDGYVIFQYAVFLHQPLGLKRRLLRKAVALLRPGVRDLDFSMVLRLINFANQPTTTGKTDIGLGLSVFLEDDKMILASWEADLPIFDWPQVLEERSIRIPGVLDLGNGWQLLAEIIEDLQSAQSAARTNIDPYQAWIDIRNRQPFFSVRGRLQGERFQPLGMGGKSMKISDFMMNVKIPKRARADWPLICAGDEIIWVPGYRMSHFYRVTERTQRVVKLNLVLQ